jgi:integrase
MQSLPSRLGPRSRRHIAQCMRKVLSLAVYPGRHIAVNPIPREWMPKIPKSANKAKSCLFPDEDAKLLSCAAVPLERRVAYGILSREGMRASELSDLRWSDVDLERGRVRLDENKTDDPRAWALSPDVVRVLTWWKKRTGDEADGRILGGLDLTQGPRWLRGKTWAAKTRHKNEPGDLRTAGVDRAELFERSKSRMPIRLHDLRATFVTVSLANGKAEQWVSDRTGHRSSQMLALYTRQARQWSELELGALRPMDALLPEMCQRADVASSPTDVDVEPVEGDVVPEEGTVTWPEADVAGTYLTVTWTEDAIPWRLPASFFAGTGLVAFAPTAGLEPATRRLTAQTKRAHCQQLRAVATPKHRRRPTQRTLVFPCSRMNRHQTSRPSVWSARTMNWVPRR